MRTLIVLALIACGAPEPEPIACPQVFPAPSLCVRRMECCWPSPFDGWHCEPCCEATR